MHPYYLGDSDRPLYGAYHPPASARRRDAGVLLCHPLGHAYLRAHRVMGQVARRLSASGAHVLQFDYFGTGDSSGDFEDGSAEQWSEDIQVAAEELRASSGARKVSVVGMRLGATLAALSLGRGGDVTDLVLWDPVVSGPEHLLELERLHHELLAEPAPTRRYEEDELLGFTFPPPLRSSIEAMVPLSEAPLDVGRILLLVSEEAPEYAHLRDSLERREVPVSYRHVPGAYGWDELDSVIMAPDSVDAVVDFLSPDG